MIATPFEFKHRFWIILGAYCLGFSASFIDPVNVVEAVLQYFHADRDPWLKTVFVVACIVISAGALMRTWGAAYLRTAVVQDKRLHTERVVADGPYRFVRNPLYLGNIALAVGLATMASRVGAAIIVLGNLIIVLRLIGREEVELKASAGESYLAYFGRVPRLIPALRPRVEASGNEPNWLDGFGGELMMWFMAASVMVFGLTLQLRWFYILLVAGFATKVIAGAAARKKAAAAAN